MLNNIRFWSYVSGIVNIHSQMHGGLTPLFHIWWCLCTVYLRQDFLCQTLQVSCAFLAVRFCPCCRFTCVWKQVLNVSYRKIKPLSWLLFWYIWELLGFFCHGILDQMSTQDIQQSFVNCNIRLYQFPSNVQPPDCFLFFHFSLVDHLMNEHEDDKKHFQILLFLKFSWNV